MLTKRPLLLLLLIYLCVEIQNALPQINSWSLLSPSSQSREAIATVNTRKWIHLLNDKFLSFNLQPRVALDFQEYRPATLNMFKGLSPAMVRLGGPETDHVEFMTKGNAHYSISEDQWNELKKFSEKAKLNFIVCLNPTDRLHGVWRTKSALELIDASDKMGFDLQWQLGYELQRLMNQSEPVMGRQLGRDVVRLRKILDSFPRYSKSVIIGPDIVDLSTSENINFVKDFLNESGDALAVLTWHPNFTKSDKDEDVAVTLSQIHQQANSLLSPNDPMKLFSLKPVKKKEVWLSESGTEGYTGDFNDALTLLKRLGTAATLGFPVYMKQITSKSVVHPTPDFWVSMLFKSLVGRAVLDAKLVAGDKGMSHVYAHCTEMSPNNIVDSDFQYERGAVTLFGANTANEEIKLNIKASLKDEPVHIYILSAENRNKAETYLNGQQLKLSPTGQLPVISPKVKNATRNVQVDIPPKSVYFIVMPDMNAKQCTMYPIKVDQNKDYVTEKLLKMKFPVPETENIEYNELERLSKSIRDHNMDVNAKNKINKHFNKDSRLDKIRYHKEQKDLLNKFKDLDEDNEDDMKHLGVSDKAVSDAMSNTKFILFSDDDWLSNFSHAKKAVTAAKKIIEAFEEAEMMRKKNCEKQSSVLKVENDKYHGQHGKEAPRKKKFAVLSTSVLDQEDNSTKDDLKTSTTEQPEHKKISLTDSSLNFITESTNKPVSGNQEIKENKLENETRNKREASLFKASEYETSKQYSGKINKKKEIARKKTIAKRMRRFAPNTRNEREEYDNKIKKGYLGYVPHSDNSDYDPLDCKPGADLTDETLETEDYDKTKNGKNMKEDIHDLDEDVEEAYHPGEFYEHRNLPKIHVYKNSRDLEDLYEAQLSGNYEQTDGKSHKEEPSKMGVEKAKCRDSEFDKTIMEKIEKDLKRYYKNTEILATMQDEFSDHDKAHWDGDRLKSRQKPYTDEQRIKRDSVEPLKENNNLLKEETEVMMKNETPFQTLGTSAYQFSPTERKTEPLKENSLQQITNDLLSTTDNLNEDHKHKNSLEKIAQINSLEVNHDKKDETIKDLREISKSNKVLENSEIKDLLPKENTKTFLELPIQTIENITDKDITLKKQDVEKLKKVPLNDLHLENEKITCNKTKEASENKDVNVRNNTQLQSGVKILSDEFSNPKEHSIDESKSEFKKSKNVEPKFGENPRVSDVKKSTELNSNTDALETIRFPNDKHNLDIVCGRTKHFKTFCVATENKIDDDLSVDSLKTNELKKVDKMPWPMKYEKSYSSQKNVYKNNGMKMGNKDWYQYPPKGKYLSETPRFGPYLEDLEEVLSHMGESDNYKRHRRLVDYTMSEMEGKDDEEQSEIKDWLSTALEDKMKPTKEDRLVEEAVRDAYDQHFNPYDYQNEGLISGNLMQSLDESKENNQDKFIRDFAREYEEFGESKKEPIKRTVMSAPIIKKFPKPHHDVNFGTPTFDEPRTSSETFVPARSPLIGHDVTSEDRHYFRETQPSGIYPQQYLMNGYHPRQNMREELNDYQDGGENYFFYRNKMVPNRGKRFLAPYFRNVQFDIDTMKTELDNLRQDVHSFMTVYPRSPSNSLPHTSKNMGEEFRRARRSTLQSVPDERSRYERQHETNEIVQLNELANYIDDSFAEDAFKEKNKYFQSNKELTELAKNYVANKEKASDKEINDKPVAFIIEKTEMTTGKPEITVHFEKSNPFMYVVNRMKNFLQYIMQSVLAI